MELHLLFIDVTVLDMTSLIEEYSSVLQFLTILSVPTVRNTSILIKVY